MTAHGVASPALPFRLGRYELLAKIAEGGMASVYLGRLQGPMGFQRPVAIKLMRPEYTQSEDFVKMFLDEARLVARLSHPNVVQLLELGQDETPIGRQHGGFFIVMECLMGESLLDTWYACQDRQLMLPFDVIAWIGARAAEGLHHAHELRDATTGASERIVHRDVNPGNIFLTYEGQVKVIDFGVAKALNRLSSTTSFGTLKGKVAYMAPEQAKTSDVDRRADVFSLAVTLWELTTDRRLFKRKNDVDTLLAVTKAEVPDPAAAVEGYPRDLSAILLRALQGNRDNRYATALDFSRDLDRFAQTQGRTVDATTLAEVMNFLFWEQRNRFVEWLRRAHAGSQSELFRAPGSQKEHLAMASIDVAPLSKRAGQTLPIRGSMPNIEAPKPAPGGNPDLGMTVPLGSQPPSALQIPPPEPSGGDATVYNPMTAPAPGMAPRTPIPQPMPMPMQQPMPMPMQQPMPVQPMPMQPMPMQPMGPIQYAPEIVRASQMPQQGRPAPQKSSIVSNIILFIVAAIGVLGIAGYFIYARMHRPPPQPAPSASVPTTVSGSVSSEPPDTGVAIASEVDAQADAQQDAGPPDTGVTATAPHTPKDSGVSDEVLLRRR